MIGWQNNFVYDVTIDAGISADGQWSGRCNTDGSFQNDCLIKAEKDKYRKHEAAYANLLQEFLPFAVSSLGGMTVSLFTSQGGGRQNGTTITL